MEIGVTLPVSARVSCHKADSLVKDGAPLLSAGGHPMRRGSSRAVESWRGGQDSLRADPDCVFLY